MQKKKKEKRSAFALPAIKWNHVIASEITCAALYPLKIVLQKVCNTLSRVACQNSFNLSVITTLLKYIPLKLGCNFHLEVRLKNLAAAVGIEPATVQKRQTAESGKDDKSSISVKTVNILSPSNTFLKVAEFVHS